VISALIELYVNYECKFKHCVKKGDFSILIAMLAE